MTSQNINSQDEYVAWDYIPIGKSARKGHLLLSMQWARSRDLNEVVEHSTRIGGSDMEAREFAHGLVAGVRDFLSRRELRTVALMFLLELERRNQETPNPQEITAIEAAVSRIARQVGHISPRMDDLPLAEVPVKLYDLRAWKAPVSTADTFVSCPESMTVTSGERFGIAARNDLGEGLFWHAAAAPKGALSLFDKCYRETEHRDDSSHELDTHFMFQAMDQGSLTLRFNLQRGAQIVDTIEVLVNVAPFQPAAVAPVVVSPLSEHNDLPIQAAE